MNPSEPTQPTTPPEAPVAPVAPAPTPIETPSPAPVPQASFTQAPVQPPAVGGADPGKGLGVAGFVVSLVSALINVFTFGIPAVIGLVLSIVGLNKSKKAGHKNGLALAGIIISAIVIVLTLAFFVMAGLGLATIAAKCAELGAGTHSVDGVEYTCS